MEAIGRILVVDDVEDNRAVLCRRLQRRGFVTVEADGGTAALARLEAESFDLVLLDVMMPDVTGLDVLAEVRTKHSAEDLPIIMVTAMSQSEDVVRALALGANDYVTKPIDFPVALARIQTQLNRKRAEDSLRATNSTLERSITERAAELLAANRLLEGEIQRRRESEAQMRHMAYHDQLTGLPNRAAFNDAVSTALSEAAVTGTGAAVILLDLDRFKEVNDTYGHAAGDGLLLAAARRIGEVLRRDDRLARLGGDEFAIVISGRSRQELAAIAERIRLAVAEPLDIEGASIVAGVSVGISRYPEDGATADELLRGADLALYCAKADGRGVHRFFDRGMKTERERRQAVERDIRDALDQGRFELHYQPIVLLGSEEIVGCEALIRLNSPGQGLVAPAEFIPVAEESGLIIQIGEWVLRRACQEAAGWVEPIRVAVNLSPLHFRRPGLVEAVAAALSDSGLDPRRLELEVTETVLLENSRDVIETLQALKSLGVSISLDDFGTGYSSMAYLLRHPFDKIKIDRSFVQSLDEATRSEDGKKSDEVIRALVSLAAGLKLTVLAEGVENAAQASVLTARGCAEAQGFYFGRPEGGEAMARLLRTRGTRGTGPMGAVA